MQTFTHTISASLTAESHAKIIARAKAAGVKPSAYVRQLLEHALAANG